MHVAVCAIKLFMPHVASLKEKRRIVKSIMQKISSRINASVAETDFQDTWQRAEIGVAMVSGDKGMLDRQISLVRAIVDDCADAETAEFEVEFV
ncbi:MAG: DUF503 domain-containing protein [Negativicutes bacterium]|nr:DUF503 domain-containing protein [Negativicutes bacterium]